MTQTKHTKTPWSIKPDKHNEDLIIIDKEGDEILSVDWYGIHEENAKFIVKAVNNHEALVEALRYLIEAIEKNEAVNIQFTLPVEKAKQALKNAESED